MTVEVPAEVAWLTEAIQAALDAPVNYLYRAEEWLVRGAVMEACADFRAAHRRAVEGLARSAWGYLYQWYIDWAEDGLNRCGDPDPAPIA